jgi:hypothetical protein
MSRKEFFQLTKYKILITEVVILLFLINTLTGVFGGPHFNFFIILPLALFTIPVFYLNAIIAFIVIVLGLIIEVIYLYAVSCFTVLIYNKCLRGSRNE